MSAKFLDNRSDTLETISMEFLVLLAGIDVPFETVTFHMCYA